MYRDNIESVCRGYHGGMRGDIAELCLTNYGARGAIAKKVKTDLAVDL